MVRKLFFIAMLLTPLFAYCGNLPYPMLKQGKTWVYDYHHYEERGTGEVFDYEEEVFEVSYTIQGDTVIGGVPYVKVIRQQDDTSTYYAAMREEGTAVFCVMAGRSNEHTTLDFDPIKLSSILKIYGNYTERKEIIKVNGREFIRHIYEPDDFLFSPKLIGVEGIGFYGGLIHDMYEELPTCICDYDSFKACYEDGECIFTEEDFRKPSETTTVWSITTATTEDSPDIYDLQGRRLSATPQKGVYIQNGKKIVVK